MYKRKVPKRKVKKSTRSWSSEEAFHGFVASDAFKKVTNWGKENILRGRPEHTTYRQNDDGSVSSVA